MEMEFTEANFDAEVIKSEIPVMVDFWAPWCGPCKAIAPIVEQLSSDYAGKVKVGKLNTDDNQQIAIEYGVMSIPTVIIFKDGKVAERMVGAPPNARDALAGRIDSVLAG